MKTFDEWLDSVIESGNMCDKFTPLVRNAKTNKRFMDLVLTSDGVSFLCEKQMQGLELPRSIINEKFGRFLNGQYTAINKTSNWGEYTSELYCDFKGHINANKTLYTFLGCNVMLNVESTHICSIYCDNDTKVYIEGNGIVYAYVYGNAMVLADNPDKVKIKRITNE